MTASAPRLYRTFFMDKSDERLELFRLLKDRFDICKGLYPGSFVHITPSFVFPEMVYADTNSRCPRFFASTELADFIDSRKEYSEPSVVRFHHVDFTAALPEEEHSFDLLISLYAGFVSQYCGRYLKTGGVLVANNSHGDAPLAFLDPSFELTGLVKRRGSYFSFSDQNLKDYFIAKNGLPIDKENIIRSMTSPGFTKTAYAYVFCKKAP